MSNLENSSLNERFQHLLKLMSSSAFLNKEGLGNEVPFFICPFDVKETTEFYDVIDKLKNQLSKRNISVLDINLYDMIFEILKKRQLLDRIFETEKDLDKTQLMELFHSVLSVEDKIIPEMSKIMKENTFQILFITGVGEVFPYIRSHSVLTNLQKEAKEQPTVLFFPGIYNADNKTGSTLNLFGVLDDKYYRAFNVYHCQV